MGKADRIMSLIVKAALALLLLLVAVNILVGLQEADGGRRAACLSNLRQMMLGIKSYTMDCGGSYPTHIPRDKEGKKPTTKTSEFSIRTMSRFLTFSPAHNRAITCPGARAKHTTKSPSLRTRRSA